MPAGSFNPFAPTEVIVTMLSGRACTAQAAKIADVDFRAA